MASTQHRHPSPRAHRASVEAAIEALRRDGGRVTSGRRAIVAAVLDGHDHHVTVDELAAQLQREHPSMAESTIYRTLETLERLAVITRVDLGQGRAVYHPVDHVHHHVVCTDCGAVGEVPGDTVGPLLAAVSAASGYVLTDDPLTVYGRCAACSD